ncbi:2-phosphosulfolactate phosphatase [Pontibacter chitinilyticus]|uniref:2-phosphosulfolactate phosphatase n=1 Tax=Pontibacter chitinilyticus TaxID=2674989 RepID=UPI00321B5F38
MASIDVCYSPALLHLYDLEGKAVVAVDILRATSTMTTAFANGAADIIPVMDLEECRTFAAKGYLTAAERDGIKADGFDLGNSPFSYGQEVVKDRTIAITTTNGTRAIRLSEAAEEIIVGSFLNLQVVADYLRELQLDVLVVCAGWKGQFNLEDTLYAGALVERLQDTFTFANDATLASLYLYRQAKDDLLSFLRQSSHVRRLENLGIEKDIAFCLQHDVFDVLPVWRHDRLVNLIVQKLEL